MTEEEKQPSRIIQKLIEDEMKRSYVDYAMSVIIGRALPDVRDGLKPVHRRILFAMNEMGIVHNKSFKKCARIVGECLGKFHPHGDSAVYDALVRMAQDFSLRYPLIQGQGNFGSVDGDKPAAMRYTESRLAKISQEVLADIDKETVNFVDNFDASLKEPTVLPSRIPNLLINGSTGIAVGMATNIPPHNLSEVCSAVIEIMDNPDMSNKDAMTLIPGPDFPTGGIIVGTSGILSAYGTGHGKIKVRAVTEVEEGKKKRAIIVKEIPYMVNKTMLIEEIAQNVRNKTIPGISDMRDESDRQGMRIVIELKRDANMDVTLNQLYKHTRLQTTFGMNLLTLDGGKPKVMTLKEIIDAFIKFRKEVITRRTGFDLRKAEERAHILEGLIIALNNIDKAIIIIKRSGSAKDAREALINGFELTDIQAQAILDMKLQRLTSLEQDKIRIEHKGLLEKIIDLKDILANPERIKEIIKEEVSTVNEKYSDKRKTQILDVEDEDIDIEDLIEKEDVVVTISHSGYIKRTPLELYKEQRRGGKGMIATTTKEEDIVEHLFIANTHDYILFFTEKGIVQWLKVYKIPDAGRYTAGKAIVNLLDTQDKITAHIKIKEFDDKHFLIMGTKKGVVKKTNLKAYSRPRAGGIKAIVLDEGDELVNVALTDGEQQVLLATKNGLTVKFKEIGARPIGRVSRGVRGVSLRKGDEVVSMMIASDDKTVLTVTENGYGKRTRVSDYRLIHRGGKGVINIICNERNGKVVDVKAVSDEDQIMFITKNGKIIRTNTNRISIIGRNTMGMRLMRLNEDDKVVAAARIVGNDIEHEEEKTETPETIASTEKQPEPAKQDIEDEKDVGEELTEDEEEPERPKQETPEPIQKTEKQPEPAPIKQPAETKKSINNELKDLTEDKEDYV